MPNPIIDLRRLKNELGRRVRPERALEPPPEHELLEAAIVADPEDPFEDTADPALLEWAALDFEPADLVPFVIGVLLLVGAAAAAVFKNFLFALLLVLAGGLVVGHAYRTPRLIRIALTGRGIEIGSRRYEFESLESFWIFYDPPLFKEVALRSRRAVMPAVRVPLGDFDPLQMREVLLRFLPEAEQELSLVDIISKRLGF